jgi:hypothetical protein
LHDKPGRLGALRRIGRAPQTWRIRRVRNAGGDDDLALQPPIGESAEYERHIRLQR